MHNKPNSPIEGGHNNHSELMVSASARRQAVANAIYWVSNTVDHQIIAEAAMQASMQTATVPEVVAQQPSATVPDAVADVATLQLGKDDDGINYKLLNSLEASEA